MAEQTKRTRSPAYPSIDLPDAIGYLRTLYKEEDRHAFALEAAATHWGYKPTSSASGQIISALKQYGLLLEEQANESRRLRLSPLALDLMVRDPADASTHEVIDGILKTAALSPKLHREIWDKYGQRLPSDATLRIYLLREREVPFNKDQVDFFISNFKATIGYAKLTADDKISEAGACDGDSLEVLSQAAPHSTSWMEAAMSRGTNPAKPEASQNTPSQTSPIPASSVPTVRDLPVTLPSLDIAVIRVKVPMSEEDYKALMGALTGMKKALVKECE